MARRENRMVKVYNALNMNDHDPRLDPQPGDVLRKIVNGKTFDRYVTGRVGNEVYYSNRTVLVTIKKCWITTWQAWPFRDV